MEQITVTITPRYLNDEEYNSIISKLFRSNRDERSREESGRSACDIKFPDDRSCPNKKMAGELQCRFHLLGKCPVIITRGLRKNQPCNKKMAFGNSYCHNHLKVPQEDACPVIIIRGPRKGQPCGNKKIFNRPYCHNHWISLPKKIRHRSERNRKSPY